MADIQSERLEFLNAMIAAGSAMESLVTEIASSFDPEIDVIRRVLGCSEQAARIVFNAPLRTLVSKEAQTRYAEEVAELGLDRFNP